MKIFHWTSLFALLLVVAIGCRQPAPQPSGDKKNEEQAKIEAAMAKLDPADRKLAEAQKMCPVGDEPLGSMGAPLKLMVKDQPVFLCCKGCKDAALKNPEATLAKVKELTEGKPEKQ